MSKPDWIRYGVPTLDRPFGLELWPIFEKAFESVKGYKPQDFRFTPGETPISTFSVTATILVSYYIIIFGGREVMRNRPAYKLNGLFKIHNFYLTAISGALLALFAEQLIPTVWRHGVFYAICDHSGGWTDKLVILYYLNYLTKFVELIDTCFLFLKKKPLTFLHTYHHGATALLCYTQLIGHTSVSWVPITLNLMVHVVMYWYYFQSARGIRIWWKKYITIMQITQFVLDLGFVYFASYTYFSSTYWPNMPSYGKCAGEEFAAIAGICILTSYLVLFIGFYIATYKKPLPKGRPRATSALIEMADEKIPTIQETRRRLSSAGNMPYASGAQANGRVTRSRKA
ncbi:elongation of fatty acids protein-like protein [Pseudovirgaria hyperparasitica]|uniref:Elongation of fatty acids protein n=1 Tax=Pseudovirgaria hyperparasitica TaxID=470096 RepID=A0A6A6VYI2_9PEZI|nr:elongation of fatty acids protein-like protein [Pseudovirgaria hyperparasitica]KAF2754784.1 elongation of fatty acids protein-like protein [Pseudovirgaria hyperparasitica]